MHTKELEYHTLISSPLFSSPSLSVIDHASSSSSSDSSASSSDSSDEKYSDRSQFRRNRVRSKTKGRQNMYVFVCELVS